MKHRFLKILIASLLAFAMALPMVACEGGSTNDTTPADTTVSADVTTEAPTEDVTEAPLPTEVVLPAGYETADTVYACHDGSTLYAYAGKTETDFEAVCDGYKALGFKVYSDTNKAGNRFTTLVGDGPMAHVYWLKDTGELNLVLSDTAANTLPPVTPEVTDGDYACSIVQMKDNTNVNGMAYIIQLKDGSYVVYDGSYSGQARKLTKYMQDNYTGEGKPTVRAWILTHSTTTISPPSRPSAAACPALSTWSTSSTPLSTARPSLWTTSRAITAVTTSGRMPPRWRVPRWSTPTRVWSSPSAT